MKKNSGFRYWLPRILGLFFAVFISIFALDAFGGGEPIGEQILGFLIHMIPSYIFIAILLIAWKWQLAGGILYILIGLFYIILVREFDLIAYLIIAGPPLLIGVLFINNHFFGAKTEERS